MKIKIEPERLKRCIDNAMISKSKPIIDPAVFVFEPEKVTNFGIYSGNVGTYQEYKKSFFLSYECKEKEIIPITNSISTELKWGFSCSEMTAETKDKKKIYFKGETDKSEPALEEHEPQEVPPNMSPFVYDKEIKGFVPTFNYNHDPEWDKKSINLNSLLEVEQEKLGKLPQANEYELIFEKSGLTIRVGSFSRKIEVKVLKDSPITIKTDSVLFNSIIDNLSGNIRIALAEDMILFIKDRKDHTITYFLATQFE